MTSFKLSSEATPPMCIGLQAYAKNQVFTPDLEFTINVTVPEMKR